jgi:hypothetical protein
VDLPASPAAAIRITRLDPAEAVERARCLDEEDLTWIEECGPVGEGG